MNLLGTILPVAAGPPEGPRSLPDVTPDKETYYRMLNDALDGNGELPVTPAQAARVMKVIDLAFKSGAENKVIHIPEGF